MFINGSRFLFVALLAAGLAGCGDSDRAMITARRVVPINEVPAPVMKVAKTTLPGVDFTESWKNVDKEGKLHSYEIRGKSSNGKVRETRITADGKVLETE